MKRRNTTQRSLIFNAVKELRCHATADEIYQYIIKSHPTISRGTVYRNLSMLSSSNEIRKIEIPGGADRYDHQRHAHYHARCEGCGLVTDVDMEFIGSLEAKIKNARGFDFHGHDIVFKGFCPECNKKRHPGKQTIRDASKINEGKG